MKRRESQESRWVYKKERRREMHFGEHGKGWVRGHKANLISPKPTAGMPYIESTPGL